MNAGLQDAGARTQTAPDRLDELFSHRVLLVTGKGGTGKTTLSVALGLAAASRGLKTLLVEVGGAQQAALAMGRAPRGYRIQPLHGRLEGLSMRPEDALEDFVLKQLKLRVLYKLAFRNRVIGPFIDAVPGLPDIIQLGKIWDLVQEIRSGQPRWDLLIVDAPATGHGLTMLAAPRSMMEMTLAGPFHANAQRVRRLFSDPATTAIVLTCLPEHLPVRETLELYAALREHQPQVAFCALNQLQDTPFPQLDLWPRARAHLRELADNAWREALELCDGWVEQSQRQERARRGLVRDLAVPVLDLPRAVRQPLELEDLQQLAAALAERLADAPETGGRS